MTMPAQAAAESTPESHEWQSFELTEISRADFPRSIERIDNIAWRLGAPPPERDRARKTLSLIGACADRKPPAKARILVTFVGVAGGSDLSTSIEILVLPAFVSVGHEISGLGAMGGIVGDPGNERWPEQGPAMVVQVGGGADFLPGAVCLPYPGEPVSGDAWAIRDRGGGVIDHLVVDGLGHGPQAASCARIANEVFHSANTGGLVPIIDRVHRALHRMRGAALAIARVDKNADEVRFCGVGNIAASLVPLDGGVIELASLSGTAGVALPAVREFIYPYIENATLVMHSDGVATTWRKKQYPGLFARSCGLIAGVLMQNHRVEKDDATILVSRCEHDPR